MSLDERDSAARLARVLDAEAEARPAAVAARLRQARLAALAGPPPARFGTRFAPAAVCATALAGFLLFAELPQGPATAPALLEDELLSAAGPDADLIADLDFYEWLEADGFHGG